MELKKHGIGYANRYKRLHPNAHRNTIANRIVDDLIANEAVDIVFLSGSTVHGGTDDFSDIDINVVVQNPQEFRLYVLRLVNTYGKVTHAFTPANLDNIFVIFLNDLTKIDFGIYSTQEFAAQKYLIKDKDAVLKGTINPIGTTTNQKSRFKKVGNTYLAMALADLIAIPREIQRNNIYEARANLDDARRHIAIYVNLINNDIYFNYNNFSQYLKKKQIDMFRKSLKNNDNYPGIVEKALLLLEIVKEFKIYENSLINNIEGYIKKYLGKKSSL